MSKTTTAPVAPEQVAEAAQDMLAAARAAQDAVARFEEARQAVIKAAIDAGDEGTVPGVFINAIIGGVGNFRDLHLGADSSSFVEEDGLEREIHEYLSLVDRLLETGASFEAVTG